MKSKPKKRRKVRAVIGRGSRAPWEYAPAHSLRFDARRPAGIVKVTIISGTSPGFKPQTSAIAHR
jgi:hypothetical protein